MTRPGFTLVEIVVGLGILALLLAAGWIFSFTYLRNQQVRAAADTVYNELRRAQTEAHAQTDDTSHGVAVFSDRVVRFEGETYATRDQAQDVETMFAGSVTVSGISEFVFPVASITPTTAGTATLSGDTLAMDITISAYGITTITEGTVSP